MKCPRCQHENPSEQKFCGECGARLSATCRGCGANNPPDQEFCGECGTRIGDAASSKFVSPKSYTPQHLAEQILTSKAALEGERKQVSVLFCDIANSTALAARIDAEGMHEMLNAFFELALAEVHRYEGTINQFLGDGFMALFGAPLAHEDHARRAGLAALAIQQRLRADSAQNGAGLRAVSVRMGINTGTVVVGKIGDNLRMDYTAVGDTTNLAARLQQTAKPGSICVSESVHAVVQPYFETKPLGKHLLKGIGHPVTVYELCGVRAHAEEESRAQTIGIASALVGRDSELAALNGRLEALLGGEGGIVALTGEPGLGKSRLVAEARRRASRQQWLWLEGRSLSFGRSLSYWPFIEILKRCFAIEEDDTEEQGWSKLEQGLCALFGEGMAEVLPYIATVLAMRVPPEHQERVKYLDSQGLGRQVFLSMRRLLERLAQRQPVVLLFEDWHWADRSSVGLAEHLLSLTATRPLLFWCVSRPDPEGPIGRIRQVAAENPAYRLHEVALTPLSQADSAVLMRNLVGTLDLPISLREQLLKKTEGNPFFIEEVIRSLVTEGILTRGPRDQSWRLAKSVEQVNIPDTIQGLILARIDRLDEEVKRVLKLASVVGRSFFYSVLLAISEAERELDSRLVQLEDAELIRLRQRLPELEYIFKHALVQEAAYGSILAERRRAIHRRVADAIERLFADRLDEFASLLAYHYSRSEDWQKAQEYLFKAGDQAGRIAADAEALEHFRQAEAAYLKAFGDKLSPLQRASLDRKMGAALFGLGRYEQAHEQFRRALMHLGYRYPTSRWGVRRAILRHLAAHFARRLRKRSGRSSKRDLDLATAQEMSASCHPMAWVDYFLDEERMVLDGLLELDVGERSQDTLAESRGLSDLGFIFATYGANGVARRYHAEAGAVAQRLGDPRAVGFTLFALGYLDYCVGMWDECSAVLEKSAAAYHAAGDVHSWGAPTVIRGALATARGEMNVASEFAEELLRIGQGAADLHLIQWGYQDLGYLAVRRGPLDEAAALLRKAQTLAVKISAYGQIPIVNAMLGECYIRQGKLDDALAVLSEALEVIKVRKLRGGFVSGKPLMGFAEALLAQAIRLEGRPRRAVLRDARRACVRALRAAATAHFWRPEALRLQGTLESLCGRANAAQERWQQSIAAAEKGAFVVERACTLLEMGRRLGNGSLVEQAADVFSQLGAKVYLASALHALAQLDRRSPERAAQALQRYEQAIPALEEVNLEYELAEAYAEYGRLQRDVGDNDQAQANFTRALDLLAVTNASAGREKLQDELRRLRLV